MATESLWNDIDAKLKSELLAYMGSGSSFSTLRLKSVEVATYTDPQRWNNKDAPFAVITGQTETPESVEHQDLYTPNQEIRYRYGIMTIVNGDQETATRDAKIMDARVRRFILNQIVSLPRMPADTLGNNVVGVVPFRAEVYVYPVVGKDNQCLGVSLRAFDVIAHMRGD